jgi:hypothetical protein
MKFILLNLGKVINVYSIIYINWRLKLSHWVLSLIIIGLYYSIKLKLAQSCIIKCLKYLIVLNHNIFLCNSKNSFIG